MTFRQDPLMFPITSSDALPLAELPRVSVDLIAESPNKLSEGDRTLLLLSGLGFNFSEYACVTD